MHTSSDLGGLRLRESELPPVRSHADGYSIIEAARLYHVHPDGIPDGDESRLLVGYPGSGKTLVLKKLCWDLLHSTESIPIFVAIEAYVSQFAGEAVYSPDAQLAEPLPIFKRAISLLLNLALVDAAMDAGLPEIAAPAIELVSHGQVDQRPIRGIGSRYRRWRLRVLTQVRDILSVGIGEGCEFPEPPNLFSVASTMGDAAHQSHCQLILLVDQIDRLRPFYFRQLTSLLRRGPFVAIVAARPSPSAPQKTPMDLGAEPDQMSHWLGYSSRNASWGNFFYDVIESRGDVPESVLAELKSRRNTVDSLFRPSVRRVIEFTDMLLDAIVRRGTSFDDAWKHAIHGSIEEATSEAAQSLRLVSGAPLAVMTDWQTRALPRRPKPGERYTGAGLQIAPTRSLGPGPERFLRVCIRDGILIPRSEVEPMFDVVWGRFEINPLIAAPPWATSDLLEFKRAPRRLTFRDADLKNWSSSRGPSASKAGLPKVLLVADDGALATSVADSLRDEFAGGAVIRALTEGHDALSTVRGADLLIADVGSGTSGTALTSYAIGVAVHFGVAIRIVRIANQTGLVGWLPASELTFLSAEEGILALRLQIENFLRRPEPRRDTYGISIRNQPRPNLCVVAATRESTAITVREAIRGRTHGAKFEVPWLGQGNQSFSELVIAAREASLLVVAVEASDVDGASVAMFLSGCFNSRKQVLVARRRRSRSIVIVDGDMRRFGFLEESVLRYSNIQTALGTITRHIESLQSLLYGVK